MFEEAVRTEAGAARPTPVVRAGIYCRISRDGEGEGKGVARQLTDCLEIAARHGWAVVDRYIDNDVGRAGAAESRDARNTTVYLPTFKLAASTP